MTKIIVLTWGRIDEVLGCAFDLFRLAIAWLGETAGHRSERIGQWGGPGREPINCQLAGFSSSLTSLNIQKWSLLFAPPSKRYLSSTISYPLIIVDDAL
jgi:hypothetical protein